MLRYNRKIVLVASDLHSGFKYGLKYPKTFLPNEQDGEEYISPLTETQKFINETLTWALEEVDKIAGKSNIVNLIMGDVTHGNKYVGEQESTRDVDQEIIAYTALKEYFLSNKKVKTMRGCIGTDAHTFGEGSSEFRVFRDLQLTFPKKSVKLVRHGLINIDGFRIDYAHHGPSPGNLKWTEGNVARSYLKDRMIRDLDAGIAPANMYLRGHYHSYTKAWERQCRENIEYESWIMIAPPLCGLGSFGSQIMKSLPRVDVGVIALEIINGQLTKSYKLTQVLEERSDEEQV